MLSSCQRNAMERRRPLGIDDERPAFRVDCDSSGHRAISGRGNSIPPSRARRDAAISAAFIPAHAAPPDLTPLLLSPALMLERTGLHRTAGASPGSGLARTCDVVRRRISQFVTRR